FGTAGTGRLRLGGPLDGTAEEGSQPVHSRRAVRYRLLGRERPGGPAAKLPPCQREAAGGDVIGEDRRLAGGAGQVPAVAEAFGDPYSPPLGTRHRPE